MRFKLFDRDEKLQCVLKDIVYAEVTEELNGEHTLSLQVLANNEAAAYIEKAARVAYKDDRGYWREFIVQQVEERHDADGICKTAFCESSFYETLGDYVEEARVRDGTARVALEKALTGTRWEAGTVDDLGLSTVTLYHTDCKNAVHRVAEVWKGEIRTRVEVAGSRITGRYVDLLARRGADRGKRFVYSKDIVEIEKKVHNEDVITALYGYGKGEEIGEGYGRRLTFEDVVWSKAAGDPADKPLGQRYIADEEARRTWGRLDTGGRVHVFSKVEFDDIEDPETLLQATYDKLQELNRPLVTYRAGVVDLKATEGYQHEGVELGDTAAVIDREMGLRIKARVVRLRKDLLNPENTEVVLGNFIPTLFDDLARTEEHVSSFRDKAGVWDRAALFDADGLPGQYLKDLTAELNARINAVGGYVYLSEDGKGITTYDKPIDQNPTMAIQIKGGAFRIANSKTPQGEWDWKTFGDGNGFLADVFVGGMLRGGKVEFDLTNGTLLIGNSVEDYQLFWDGQTLSVKGALYIGGDTQFEAGYDPSDKADRIDHDELSNIVSEYASLISANADELLLKASRTDVDLLQQTVEQHSAEISTVSEQVAIEITRLDGDISAAGEGLSKVKSYFTFRDDGFMLGKTDSPLNINISNEQMDFIDTGQIVAYINGQKMFIDSLEVLSSLLVGAHKAERYDAETTLIRWVG